MPALRDSLSKSSHAVANLLKDSFKSRASGAVASYKNKHGVVSKEQTDVIGEKLCDDIIEYLAPSLEKHKGCTLIDFFPGPCIWSARLHDFLQPKRHLLIEPDDRYFEPFIKPLIDRPGSTYQHTSVEHEHPHHYLKRWSSIATAMGPLTETKPSSDQADSRSLRSDILATGNWARKFLKPHRLEQNAMGSPIDTLNQLARRPMFNEAFHSSGLVRMLWWFPEEVKPKAFPNRIAFRLHRSAWLDASCALTEVAGLTPYDDYALLETNRYRLRVPRWKGFEAASDSIVSERMKAAKMTMPKGRKVLRPSSPSSPPKSRGDDNHLKSPFIPMIDSPSKLKKVIKTCQRRMLDISDLVLVQERSSQTIKDMEALLGSISHKYVPAAFERSAMTQRGASVTRAALVADLAVSLVNLEANFKRVEEKDSAEPSLDEMRQEILALGNQVHFFIQGQNARGREEIQDFIDEQIAFYSSGSLLSRNLRAYEPLRANKSDFWPTRPLTLLDMAPYGRDLTVPDLADQQQVATLFYMLTSMFRSSRTSVVEALDRLAINAGQDLPPMCPSMMDVRKGGRLNPKHLRVRQLTGDMLEELAKAFFEWPFRPLNWEVAFAGALSQESGSEATENLTTDE